MFVLGLRLFGFGGGTQCSTLVTMLAKWFKGRELALAISVNLSVGRLGSVLNDNLSPALNNVIGLHGTFYFGAIVLCISVIAACGAFFLDRNAEKVITKCNEGLTMPIYDSSRVLSKLGAENNPRAHSFLMLLYHTLTKLIVSIRTYSLGYWLLLLICLIMYGDIIPFHSISQKFVLVKFFCTPNGFCCDSPDETDCPNYAIQTSTAGTAISIPYMIGIFCLPVIGKLVDKFGYRGVFLLISSALMIVVHTILFLASDGDIALMYCMLGLQGISYSIFAATIWSSVAYVVEEDLVGSAYGVMNAAENGGQFVFPLIISFI